MPFSGRRIDRIAGMQLDELFAARLDVAAAFGDVQRLPCRVTVPGRIGASSRIMK